MQRRQFMLAAGAALSGLAPRFALAQTYPTRPVRAVVAFAPGGVADTFARILTQKLSEHFGKQFYVDNITGATGNIGTAQVAKAAPDGYTLGLSGTGTHAINPTLYANVGYDPRKDFTPVGLIATSALFVLVNNDIPAKTIP